MSVRKLIVFGDSWCHGDELVDPELVKKYPNSTEKLCSFKDNDAYRINHCYGGLLSKQLGLEYENYGQPGASLQSTVWTFLWWLKNCYSEDAIILVALTSPDRQSWYNPQHRVYENDKNWHRYIHSTWIESKSSVVPKIWQDFGKQYTALSNCDILSELNYQQTVLFFNGIAETQHLNLLQFNIFHLHQPIPGVTYKTLIWEKQPLKDRLLKRDDAQQIHAPERHPNEQGHKIIAELLLAEINRHGF